MLLMCVIYTYIYIALLGHDFHSRFALLFNLTISDVLGAPFTPFMTHFSNTFMSDHNLTSFQVYSINFVQRPESFPGSDTADTIVPMIIFDVKSTDISDDFLTNLLVSLSFEIASDDERDGIQVFEREVELLIYPCDSTAECFQLADVAGGGSDGGDGQTPGSSIAGIPHPSTSLYVLITLQITLSDLSHLYLTPLSSQ